METEMDIDEFDIAAFERELMAIWGKPEVQSEIPEDSFKSDVNSRETVESLIILLEDTFAFYEHCGKVVEMKREALNMDLYASRFKSILDLLVILEQRVDELVAKAKMKERKPKRIVETYYTKTFIRFKDKKIMPMVDNYLKIMFELYEMTKQCLMATDSEAKKLEEFIETITEQVNILKIDPLDDDGNPLENLLMIDEKGISYPLKANVIHPFAKCLMAALCEGTDGEQEGSTHDYNKAIEIIDCCYPSYPEDVKKTVDGLKTQFFVLDSSRLKWELILKAAQKSFVGLRFNLQQFKDAISNGTLTIISQLYGEHTKKIREIFSKYTTIMSKLNTAEDSLRVSSGIIMWHN